MNRFEYLHIKDRPLVTGIFTYNDDFIAASLHRYSFNEALHLYLVQQGYHTVVFYTATKGLASLSQEMLERFMMDLDEEAALNSASSGGDDEVVQPILRGRFSNSELARRLQRRSGAPGIPKLEPVNVSSPHKNLYLDKNDKMWHMRGINEALYAIDCIKYNLANRRDVAIIVYPNESGPEYRSETTHAQVLIEALRDVAGSAYLDSSNVNNNRFLVVINVESCRHKVMQLFDRDAVPSPSVFMNPFFVNLYTYRPEDSDFNTLSPEHAFCVPSPTAVDVRRILLKARYDTPDRITVPVDWANLSDILDQIELADKYTVRGLYNQFRKMSDFTYQGFKAMKVQRIGDVWQSLQNDLIGLDNVKQAIRDLQDWIELMRSKGEELTGINKHMMFYGNPGTGKTTVARYIGQLFKDMGLLRKGHCVETDSEGLVAGYVGQTAIKTSHVIEKALDGVLFIDEAYTLAKNDFGHEAMDTLIPRMENYRDRLVVIFAGYKEPMLQLFTLNEGLKSRIATYIDFPDYTPDELLLIFKKQASRRYQIPTETEEALVRAIAYALGYKSRHPEDGSYKFSNARMMRNLFEQVERRVGRRQKSSDTSILIPEDLVGLDMDEIRGFTL